jgi:hypothetical protein
MNSEKTIHRKDAKDAKIEFFFLLRRSRAKKNSFARFASLR